MSINPEQATPFSSDIERGGGAVTSGSYPAGHNHAIAAPDLLVAQVTAEEFVALYIAARGYSIDQSSRLQDISPSIVSKNLHNVTHTLGANTLAHTVALSLDAGLLPNPAKQEQEEIPEDVELDEHETAALEFAVSGLLREEVGQEMGRVIADKAHASLYKKLSARNLAQAVWRGYQIELFTPTKPERGPNPRHMAELRSVEESLGEPILALGRKLPMPEIRERGIKRYEDFIITLLDTDSFAIYHPRLATHLKDSHGYTPTQWRNLISHLGPKEYDIVRLKQQPTANRAHGIELNVAALQEGRDHKFITPKVLLTYARRLKETGIENTAQLHARRRHEEEAVLSAAADQKELLATYVGLSTETQAVLPPVLRTAAGLIFPEMQGSFASSRDLVETLMNTTGQTAEEIGSAITALQKRRLLDFDKNDDGRVRLELNKKGKRILEAGISRAVREIEESRKLTRRGQSAASEEQDAATLDNRDEI